MRRFWGQVALAIQLVISLVGVSMAEQTAQPAIIHRPEQPIERPIPSHPIERPVRPILPIRPPAQLPHRWQGARTYYWVAPSEQWQPQSLRPDQVIEVEIEANDRAELLLIDGRDKVVFDGWLGMGDLRTWQVVHPASLYFSEVHGFSLKLNGSDIDLSTYPQDQAVSLTLAPEAE
ncbi:DUF4115 domain-containing protein [Agarivorans sp. MS3-6]|uniref:DUF4115 domain-containing protein n=1 Tax=Agarivorans sp. TSD2052 TaxID=2937286 RepID=UPI00200DF1F9|nr:DUF4115 domain-containing protein [Agarivorans sp. TSD2052]UPW18946.1 DUF4115 domain-containing protein [Agarivorans sp. TSD2052]